MFLIPKHVQIRLENNTIHLLNLLNGAEIVIEDQEEINHFNDILRCNDHISLDNSTDALLYQEGFIVDEKAIEDSYLVLQELLEHSANLTIMPTLSCNFKCTYCYQEHKSESLSLNQLKLIESYIHDLINEKSIDFIDLNWFGGEPLLELDKILFFNAQLLAFIKNKPITFRSGITTNGYLLNDKVFCELYNVGIKYYQITLDGFSHDKTRPFSNGHPTLSQILQNIKLIKQLNHFYDYRITIRHNILANDIDFSWYDFLKSIIGSDNRFSFSIYNAQQHELSSKDLNYVKTGNNSLKRKHEEYIERIGLKLSSSFDDPLSATCSASIKNGFVFKPNGDILKCTLALEDPLNIVGHINDMTVFIDSDKNKKWYDNKLSTKCYQCNRYASCMNKSCPYKRIVNQKEQWCIYE